jgi:hypothetical protein
MQLTKSLYRFPEIQAGTRSVSVHDPVISITSEVTTSVAPLQTAIPGNKNTSYYTYN